MSNAFIEFDLAGAEWVIVAYLSEDPNMLRIVEGGLSPHVETGKLISRAPEELVLREHELLGDTTDPDTLLTVRSEQIPELLKGDFFIPRCMTIRKAGKKSNHGLNYDMRYRRFALENEMPETDAKPIVELYRTKAYPCLVRWHESIRKELKDNNRVLTNLLGMKVRLLDQPGSDLWDKAYSYKPQSTVSGIILQAMKLIYDDETPLFEPMRMKANVHDSLLLQYPVDPWERFIEFACKVRKYMSPVLHCNGRDFSLGVDAKYGFNWGDMNKLELPKCGSIQ
jgi:hypothetical protein